MFADMFRKKVKEIKVDDSVLETYIDETCRVLTLKITLNPKFISERSFPNTLNGREEMESLIKKLKTVKDIKSFFGV